MRTVRLTNLTMILKTTSTQVVETSVTTNNSPYQDYTNPDDQPTTNNDSPGFRPFSSTIFFVFAFKGHVPEDNQKSFTGIPSKSSTLTTSAKIAEKQGVQTQRILPITSTKQEPVPSHHTYQGLPTTKGVPTKIVGQGIVPPSNGKSVTSDKVKAAAETSQKQNLNAVKEGKKVNCEIVRRTIDNELQPQ